MTSIFLISVDSLAWLCIPCDLLLCERNESRAFINTEIIVQWRIQGTGLGGPVPPPLFLNLAEKFFGRLLPLPPYIHTYVHVLFIRSVIQ